MKPSATPPPVAPIVVAAPKQPNGKIQKSLVRITSTEVEPDYRAPWNTGAIGRGVGAGFVIEGPRIMTNAHVVSNTRYLTVERDGDPNKYPARVVFVAHDCDLALITVDSPEFFKNMVPLGFGESPSWNRPFRPMVTRLVASACRSLPGSFRALISSSTPIRRSTSISPFRSARRSILK